MDPQPVTRLEAINLGFMLLGYALGAVVLIGSVFEIRYLLRRTTPKMDWVFALISIGSLAAMSLMMCTHSWYGLGLYSLLLLPVVLATAFAQMHSRLGDVRLMLKGHRATRDEMRREMLQMALTRDIIDEDSGSEALSAGNEDGRIDRNDV